MVKIKRYVKDWLILGSVIFGLIAVIIMVVYFYQTGSDFADKKDRKFVDLVLEIVANLYRGNAPYSPDTVEYKITMGTFKKLEKLLSTFRVDTKKLLSGYTLAEFIEPLLYNSGPDDDNATVDIK